MCVPLSQTKPEQIDCVFAQHFSLFSWEIFVLFATGPVTCPGWDESQWGESVASTSRSPPRYSTAHSNKPSSKGSQPTYTLWLKISDGLRFCHGTEMRQFFPMLVHARQPPRHLRCAGFETDDFKIRVLFHDAAAEINHQANHALDRATDHVARRKIIGEALVSHGTGLGVVKNDRRLGFSSSAKIGSKCGSHHSLPGIGVALTLSALLPSSRDRCNSLIASLVSCSGITPAHISRPCCCEAYQFM